MYLLSRLVIAALYLCALRQDIARENASGFSGDEIAAFLAYHNEIRQIQGAPPVIWDPKLAAYAQTWADNLAQTNQFQHRRNNSFGENLYFSVGGSPNVLEAAVAWTSERRNYRGEAISEQNFMEFGHYTQMIWGATERIGAGKVKTRDGRFYVCCNYDPPGNLLGQAPVTNRISSRE